MNKEDKVMLFIKSLLNVTPTTKLVEDDAIEILGEYRTEEYDDMIYDPTSGEYMYFHEVDAYEFMERNSGNGNRPTLDTLNGVYYDS